MQAGTTCKASGYLGDHQSVVRAIPITTRISAGAKRAFARHRKPRVAVA
jgi:hypothetical protein